MDGGMSCRGWLGVVVVVVVVVCACVCGNVRRPDSDNWHTALAPRGRGGGRGGGGGPPPGGGGIRWFCGCRSSVNQPAPRYVE
jgi:hypothetical protein